MTSTDHTNIERIRTAMSSIETRIPKGTLLRHTKSERTGRVIYTDGRLAEVQIEGSPIAATWVLADTERIGTAPPAGGQDRAWRDDAEAMSRAQREPKPRLPRPFEAPLQVKRTRPDADLPNQATRGDAGYDLTTPDSGLISAGDRALVGTGIAVAIPEGYVGFIKPRSGLANRNGINILGGVIDAGYRGEVKVILHNTDREHDFMFSPGDRIAQLVVQPVMALDITEVEDFTEATERGTGGFGSTGSR